MFLKLIIDAFGGDNAPDEIIKGVYAALDKTDCCFSLCGNEPVIRERISALSLKENPRIDILHAETKIEGDDEPVDAIRHKKDSSIVVGLNALKEGYGDGFISAGNTGAVFAGATLLVKRIKGVKRAAIITVFPTATGPLVLLDTGANVTLRAECYPQLAIMGAAYSKLLFGTENPRVGLVNIGEEATKGTDTVVEAYELLNNTEEINFAGNFEIRNLLAGGCDVIVCDGWTGNIVLKTLEGTAKAFMKEIKEIFNKNLKTKLSALGVMSELSSFKAKFDYKAYGGAPIVGVEKPVIKAHGSSDARAIVSAILQAEKYINGNVVGNIKTLIENS